SSLRDLAWPDSDRHRTLKRAVNKVSPLRGFTGNRQSWQGKPRRGNTLLTGCFSFRLQQASTSAKPRRGDTLLIRRQAYPVNNPRIYPGVNAASSPMNAGGVTLLGNKYYKL
ncbi:MAG: hypothetical protein LBP72_00865, partial [Dysgonamonadaceae bacterium]|nr:hypothetical protein [Dysgonamonadaceae bacterium]